MAYISRDTYLVSMFITMFLSPLWVYLVWNHMLVDLFSLPEITYWQAFLMRLFVSALLPSSRYALTVGDG